MLQLEIPLCVILLAEVVRTEFLLADLLQIPDKLRGDFICWHFLEQRLRGVFKGAGEHEVYVAFSQNVAFKLAEEGVQLPLQRRPAVLCRRDGGVEEVGEQLAVLRQSIPLYLPAAQQGDLLPLVHRPQKAVSGGTEQAGDLLSVLRNKKGTALDSVQGVIFQCVCAHWSERDRKTAEKGLAGAFAAEK